MVHSSSLGFQCGTLTLLVLPAITLLVYLLTVFPHNPASLVIQPSLSSLSKDSRSWQIYAEDFFQGGAYVTFPHGRVRYWLLGPEDGTRVSVFYLPLQICLRALCQIVLIHGLSVPAIIWRDVAPQLASNGYRVLLYGNYLIAVDGYYSLSSVPSDLYGRGYSDAPKTTYDTTLYVTQLALLMQYIGWENTHVVGLSMVSWRRLKISSASNSSVPGRWH